MSVVVRSLAPTDETAWRRLFRDYGTFYATSFDDAQLDHVWRLLLDPTGGVDALVAETAPPTGSGSGTGSGAGEVVGFAHYRSHPDTFSSGSDWYLDDLFVDPAARGAGAATALIEHLTARAKQTGPGTLRWITAADNERAQRVYDRISTRTTWVTYEVRL